MSIYSRLVRPVMFRMDPERAHRIAIGAGAWLGPLASMMRPAVPDDRLAVDVAGLRFPNPIGLAAGFDKSGEAIDLLGALGFGFLEVGSVSLDPSDGNPRPRLFRLPQDEAIVIHYGVPNAGAQAVASRIGQARRRVPLGVNIVKTNRGPSAAPESADAIIGEYVETARFFAPRADYLMLNLSCPNTENGRDFFADRAHLDACLAALSEVRLRLPVFIKVSPVGGVATIERVLAAAEPHDFVAGFMFNVPPGKPEGLRTPATVWRAMPGAVSGPPAARVLDDCVRECHRRMDRRRYTLFAAGGVSSAADAYAKIRAGASLVGLVTALVYHGPGVVRRIRDGLARLLRRDGFGAVSEAVGIDAC
jgi:dihydroorotate dehydrogenase